VALAPIVQPYYCHARPNEDICLYRGPLTVANDSLGSRAPAFGRVTVNWMPQPTVVAEVQANLAEGPMALFPSPEQTALCPRFRRLPRQRTMRRLLGRGDVHAEMKIAGGEAGLIHETVPTVLMHVVNLERAWTGRLVAAGPAQLPESLTLVGRGWNIAIDPSPSADSLRDELRVQGGYAMTHTVRAERSDGSMISLPDAMNLQEALSLFFRFGLGRSVTAILPVGVRTNGDAAWASWLLPSMDPLRVSWSWMDYQIGYEWERLWPPYITRWQDPYWELVFRLVIGYYMLANQPRPVNLAIGTAHMVLDLLAYSILVEDRHLLSKSQFEARSATENLRELLATLGISTAIPAASARLQGFIVGGRLADGPQIVAKLRNEVAHLRRGRSVRPTDFLVEAWQLAMWYIEMVIFKLLPYSGQYHNRLTGDIEPVP
jgi:hypothetical protein